MGYRRNDLVRRRRSVASPDPPEPARSENAPYLLQEGWRQEEKCAAHRDQVEGSVRLGDGIDGPPVRGESRSIAALGGLFLHPTQHHLGLVDHRDHKGLALPQDVQSPVSSERTSIQKP